MAGAGAARLLEAACTQKFDSTQDTRIELVRELARALGDQLEALADLTAELPSPDLAAEAALRCADLSNLAACNLDGLQQMEARLAAASVHLCGGAVRALRVLTESADEPGSRPSAMNDILGSAWRADLAVRQTRESLEAKQ
jgi:hypothetical protein